MNIELIRKISIQALSSNDELFEKLVLKGGNLLSLVYGLNNRSSNDLDYSLKGQLSNEDILKYTKLIEKCLIDNFRRNQLVIFDFKFKEKPKTPLDSQLALFWGGYCLEFKVIEQAKFDSLNGDLDSIRRQAIPLVDSGSTKMQIDISKYEYVEGEEIKEIDGFAVKVYSPLLVVCEKIRAICQQMPEYLKVIKSNKPSPRPRDFFDIYHVATNWKIDFTSEENSTVLKNVFEAKKVPLSLLYKIADTYDFHEQDFPKLEAVVDKNHKLDSFLFYFDFTKKLVEPVIQDH